MKRLQLIGPGMTDIRLGHELDELNVRFPPLAVIRAQCSTGTPTGKATCDHVD